MGYGAGKKGVPFKTDCGWTDKARKLGYGKKKDSGLHRESSI
jgi:hypothetical protein